jgi:hypothetical protein
LTLDAHQHRRGIDDLHDRHARTRFFPLLDLHLLSRAPDHSQNHHAGNRRLDDHPRRVVLGRFHRLVGAIALDLENAQIGLSREALEIERRAKLFLFRLRLLEPLLVLFLIDAAQIRVLLHLEAGVLDGIRRDRKLGLVLRARLFLLPALLANLLFEIAVFGSLVDGGLQLILPVEFHEELPGLDVRAAGDELRDDEGITAWSCRADEAGRRDIVKMDRFDEAGRPQRFDKRAALDLPRRRSLARPVIGTARADATDDRERAGEHHQNERNQQVRLFHRVYGA